ncbi:hypothetical protein SGHV129 [Glossina pallidipes salivary gland hypertrophy virus]|uniref:Uncharacterized protein n=1 Tax=Glossina hytrovirus (isolate Glossina pallidipes/Ethiopia/Seibersdorf/-) TaxID=379529 RepID=B0YLT3_GHVS|nr:hypothetical protein SGHV129 [Glossina pallidipes salivary gland hypertrophy virus]ABQ08902.1 hypothetical protein SGHV129 [Glossina pallidipes salivary gland hypertrophy virus]
MDTALLNVIISEMVELKKEQIQYKEKITKLETEYMINKKEILQLRAEHFKYKYKVYNLETKLNLINETLNTNNNNNNN